MKNLLFIVAVLFTCNQALRAEEPKWSNEKIYWEYFDTYIIGTSYQNRTFFEDIQIQLKGSYSKEDSVFIENLISEIKPLIRKVDIYMVESEGNYLLYFKNNPDSSARKKIPRLSNDIKLFFHSDTISKSKPSWHSNALEAYFGLKCNYEYFRVQNGIEKSNINISFNEDAPQNIRNKYIQFLIINSLVEVNNKYTKERRNAVKDSSNIFSCEFDYTVGFNEIDKYVLYKSYSRSLFTELFRRSPQKVYSYLEFSYGNYSYLIVFSFSFLLLVAFFLILFWCKVFENPALSYKGYMVKGMIILQSATLLFIVYSVIKLDIIHSKPPFIRYLEVLAYANIFNFISLNIIYVAEKLLIRKNTTMPFVLLIQFIIPVILLKGFILYVYLVYGVRSNVMIITFLTSYGLFMIFMRLAYNFLQFKTQNVINAKDIELSHIREMKHKAELQALQSRINPHFLYNSLNSIAGLAKSDPVKTEHMALALSDFCRYAINKQNETYATIEEEAEIAKTYLDIEKYRFGEKFDYSISIADDCKKEVMPRFLIQPIIENAVKHGISKILGKGLLKLEVVKTIDGIKVSVYDNGPAFPHSPISGYGLQSIFDTLELLYKGKAYLNFVNLPEKHIFIFIPLTAQTNI